MQFNYFLYLKVDQIFSEIDPKPLGAASLAQVHKAKLRSTGENVAIKVQHSYVRGDAKIDIAIIEVPYIFFLISSNRLLVEITSKFLFYISNNNTGITLF